MDKNKAGNWVKEIAWDGDFNFKKSRLEQPHREGVLVS